MKKHLKKAAIALIAAAVLTAAALSGLLYRPDNTLCDALYQSPGVLMGNVIIIGIDESAMEELGPLPWSRDIMGMAIETLNVDEETRPAVIGIDVLYAGEGDPEDDGYLVDAAGAHGNVVLACAASFGSELVVDGDDFYMDESAVVGFDEPYDALKAVTSQGHINSMLDADGILRHALYSVALPDGTLVPSFHRVIYAKYAEYAGLEKLNTPPVDADEIWYAPFSGLPGDYSDGWSVADLLNGDIPADAFAGKVVLIGPYAAGLQDSFFTSADHAKAMFGVEYQANLIDALIAGNFKSEAEDAPQVLLLFLLSVMCLYFFLDRKIFAATLAWLSVSGGWVGICLLAYRAGLVLHVLWIPLSATVLYVVALAVNYFRAAVERRRVTSTFKRYVAPEIVGEILKEGSDALGLGGKLTDIAVLFVDIRGFTTMSEALQPPEVVEILNSYLELTSRCIMKNGGTLDKFIGDATMAFWGAPLPQEDYVFKAVKTAMDMVEGAKSLGAELEQRFGRSVGFGVGVHCGKAVVGNIGAKMRMDYTAIGDTVNTASRLESNAPAGTVLISRAVVDVVGDRIIATSLGDSIRLKGKAAGFEVLKVDGLVGETIEEE